MNKLLEFNIQQIAKQQNWYFDFPHILHVPGVHTKTLDITIESFSKLIAIYAVLEQRSAVTRSAKVGYLTPYLFILLIHAIPVSKWCV